MLPDALLAVTTPCAAPDSLLPFAAPAAPLLWSRRGHGLVGRGVAARLEFSGPDRVLQAAAAWHELAARSRIDDRVRAPGTGLVAFGAFAFADDSATRSVLIVPELLYGTDGAKHWLTRITPLEAAERAADGGESVMPWPDEPIPAEGFTAARASFGDGALPPERYREAVVEAVRRIQAGQLEKTVLARTMSAQLAASADLRSGLEALSSGYPDCWTYAVDGLLGSSPEMLVRVADGEVGARVLAGSTARGDDARSDQEAALALATSVKDQDEHHFALQSVLNALRPHTGGLAASELPFTLKLPNLWHLASDVTGRLADGSTSLELVAAVHPTAAVAGTPRREALAVLAELEGFDRGRYAGPVGWLDASGDGEWAIALRSAQHQADGTITAYAGCGIVAESDPESELAETAMKFQPIMEAFGA